MCKKYYFLALVKNEAIDVCVILFKVNQKLGFGEGYITIKNEGKTIKCKIQQKKFTKIIAY